jgi:nucleotide-binding universal stress UspA family protein
MLIQPAAITAAANPRRPATIALRGYDTILEQRRPGCPAARAVAGDPGDYGFGMLYERILVGTDGSETAGRAVARAVGLAKATGASLTILHVGAGAKGEKVLDTAVRAHRDSGVTIDGLLREGDPAEVLADVAEHDGYDLLVVGNKGMTGAARFFLGSVPNKVSHHARLSLMIVHTS